VSYSRNQVPLGAVLQQAGLVSAEQVNQALKQQKQTNSNLTIGEILANQGGISPQTADFFAERWFDLVAEKPKQPIGQYLKQAALLNEQQVQAILAEQQNSKSKFGEIAIAKGWIKQTTLDFFLSHLKTELSPVSAAEAMGLSKESPNFRQGLSELSNEQEYSEKVHEGFLEIKRKLLKIEGQGTNSAKTLERVLSWTNGHSFLTQKLFVLITQGANSLSPQLEAVQIDSLVQTKIIDDWSNNELKSHLNGIRTRILNNQHCSPQLLLQLYQKILSEKVLVDGSKEQQELLNSGLVVRKDEQLVSANRIYQSVFNLNWVARTLRMQAHFEQEKAEVALRHNPPGMMKPPRSLIAKNARSPISYNSPRTTEAQDSWFNLKNLLLLITLIGLLSILLNNISKRIAVKTAFQQGNEFLKQKSYSEAVEEYNKLLKIDSNYFQAWTNRGYALAGLQKYEAMRESCSTAAIINPAAVYAWNCQGEAFHNLRQEQEAIAAFDQAISLNQTDPIFLINKSESLGALGDNQGSLDSIQQAIKILEQTEVTQGAKNIAGEFAVAYTFLGNSYRQQHKFNQAIASYERAIYYAPSYFPARVGKGITLSSAKRDQEATVEFQKILADSQLTTIQQAQTSFYLGKTLCQARQNRDAIAAFDRAIKLKPDYEMAKKAKRHCG
jgi:tetratricopeptide (TPR) repeat protein